ncbi:SDR family NAD(P)-dependent oxidoreductase [Paraburkholderia sp. JHI2823]|uniref:SDR family NAD(P)-dependent oxidoreductase n=1 Tax=Paraburkholderia TaxID=1822464 RepID=UPI000406083E|nr:SDR family NAD(P)-dependent oxidoreductase [Paraburkholderia mimosarum]
MLKNEQIERSSGALANARPLQGRVALITGAGRGLGGVIARHFARAGADIVICDVDQPALEETREAVEAIGARCIALACDITSSARVREMFATIVERFGTLHILVNNAALGPTAAADEMRRNRHYAYITTPQPRQALGFTSEITDEDWHRYWDVNVHGMFYCTREALKLMQAQGYGRIVNLASVAGFSTISAHSPHYSASKGAVIAFTRTVAAEVAGGNILVNALAPGGVQTPFFEQYLDSIGEEARNRFWQLIPAGRFGTMDEYAAVATFLAGDHYFVGQVISPNGGAVI